MKELFYLLSVIVTITAFAQNEPEAKTSQEKKKPRIEKKEIRHGRDKKKHKDHFKHPRPPQKPETNK